MDATVPLSVTLIVVGLYTTHLILSVSMLRKMIAASLLLQFKDDKEAALAFLEKITDIAAKMR